MSVHNCTFIFNYIIVTKQKSAPFRKKANISTFTSDRNSRLHLNEAFGKDGFHSLFSSFISIERWNSGWFPRTCSLLPHAPCVTFVLLLNSSWSHAWFSLSSCYLNIHLKFWAQQTLFFFTSLRTLDVSGMWVIRKCFDLCCFITGISSVGKSLSIWILV